MELDAKIIILEAKLEDVKKEEKKIMGMENYPDTKQLRKLLKASPAVRQVDANIKDLKELLKGRETAVETFNKLIMSVQAEIDAIRDAVVPTENRPGMRRRRPSWRN